MQLCLLCSSQSKEQDCELAVSFLRVWLGTYLCSVWHELVSWGSVHQQPALSPTQTTEFSRH
jgi:hypothetical protein